MDGVAAEMLNGEPRTGLQRLRTVCTGVGELQQVGW